jgi:predicted transcriptional regulator
MSGSKVDIEIETQAAFEARALMVAHALDEGNDVKEQVHLSFADIEVLLGVLTPRRFALLRALRRSGPMSVRALAANIARDYKAVHGDVAALIEHGLIDRRAKDKVAVLWDHVHADMRLAA